MIDNHSLLVFAPWHKGIKEVGGLARLPVVGSYRALEQQQRKSSLISSPNTPVRVEGAQERPWTDDLKTWAGLEMEMQSVSDSLGPGCLGLCRSKASFEFGLNQTGRLWSLTCMRTLMRVGWPSGMFPHLPRGHCQNKTKQQKPSLSCYKETRCCFSLRTRRLPITAKIMSNTRRPT